MRVLSDLSGILNAIAALQSRMRAGRHSRARRLALRPRVTPLRVVHPDEIRLDLQERDWMDKAG